MVNSKKRSKSQTHYSNYYNYFYQYGYRYIKEIGRGGFGTVLEVLF